MYSIIDLIPFKEDKILSDRNDKIYLLKTIIFLCGAVIDSVYAFRERKYTRFDAQVSENLCQIRTYYLIQYIKAEKDRYEDALTETTRMIIDINNRAHKALTIETSLMRGKEKGILLKDFLSKYNIFFRLQEIAFFLVQTFLLSKYKITGEHEISYGINYQFFCKRLDISSNTFAKKMIHKLQRNLSKISCEFINQLMMEVGYNRRHFALMSDLYFQDEVERCVLPCYEVTKVILSHARLKKEVFKIKVTRIAKKMRDSVEFSLSLSKGGFYYSDTIPDSLFTFVGLVCYENDQLCETKAQYIERFVKTGFQKIILANIAQHPQYPGKLLLYKKDNPYVGLVSEDKYEKIMESNFMDYKKMSYQMGCAPNNSTLFLLTHIRCDDLEKNEADDLNKETLGNSSFLPAEMEAVK